MKNGAFSPYFEANLKKSDASPIIKNINRLTIFSKNEFDKKKNVVNMAKNTS